jgi:plasmid stability protein
VRGRLWYCDGMRNITVSVDDETYKRARVAAAERDTSVSALVKAYLEQLVCPESEFERLKREEHEIRSQIVGFSASNRLSREEIHGRSR